MTSFCTKLNYTVTQLRNLRTVLRIGIAIWIRLSILMSIWILLQVFTCWKIKIFFTFYTAVPVYVVYLSPRHQNDISFNILDSLMTFLGYISAFHLVKKDTDLAPDRHALDDIQASDPDPAKTMQIRPGSRSIPCLPK